MVVVIGGGPAGMAAALFAARAGARVTLLERNEKLGKKLYITGKGRCNLTNTADAEAFFAQVPHNPRFLNAAVRRFSHVHLRALMDELGVPTVVERGGRVFPASQKASDVNRALERALRQAGVSIRLNARVAAIAVQDGLVSAVGLEGGELIPAGAVVVATGGAAYPATGSTGDGYALLQALGHQVYPPRPALVPLETAASWPLSLQGLALKNVSLRAQMGGRILFQAQGEMLFTHFGISGPLVLEMSSALCDVPLSQVKVSLDLKPGLTPEALDVRLLRDLEAAGRRQFTTILTGLLPSRLAEIAPQLLGIPGQTLASQFSRAQRQQLGNWLKAVPLDVKGFRGLEEAIITRGGLEVKEIDPKTMASKRVNGLYVAGELLDVDAHTGGFNLQIAFSTGVLAGLSAGEIAP